MGMINNIQALRAFAALNVVYFHIISTARSYRQDVSLLGFLEGWGCNGVDIFFVISGFVMVYTASRNPKPAQVFLRNRVARIAPIYWIMTLFFVAVYLVLPSAFRELTITPSSILSSLFFMSGVFSDGHPIIYVGWTLEYEMLFYLLFGTGIFLKLGNNAQLLFCTAALGLLMALGKVDPMVLEFAFGMGCARLYLNQRLRAWGIPAFICALVLLAASVAATPTPYRVIVYGIPALLLVFGALHLPQVRNRIAIFLGGASYSIYLVQVLTIPAFYKFSSKFRAALNADLVSFLCMFATTAFGALLYQFVERPLTAWLTRQRQPPMVLESTGGY